MLTLNSTVSNEVENEIVENEIESVTEKDLNVNLSKPDNKEQPSQTDIQDITDGDPDFDVPKTKVSLIFILLNKVAEDNNAKQTQIAPMTEDQQVLLFLIL